MNDMLVTVGLLLGIPGMLLETAISVWLRGAELKNRKRVAHPLWIALHQCLRWVGASFCMLSFWI